MTQAIACAVSNAYCDFDHIIISINNYKHTTMMPSVVETVKRASRASESEAHVYSALPVSFRWASSGPTPEITHFTYHNYHNYIPG